MSYKISIIIPCYNIQSWANGEKYLFNAITSLTNQSIGFENLEVILVNDGSSDETLNILNNYSQKYENIKSISLSSNMGQGMARYYGTNEAGSKYIMFLDADDEYSSQSCEKLYNIIKENNADIVSSNYIINLNGVNYTGFNYDKTNKKIKPQKSLKKYQKQYAVWGRIFKKDTIKNIENNLNALEDSYFNYSAFLKSDTIIYINDFYSCIHNVNYDSFTLKPSINTIINAFKNIDYILELVKKESDDDLNIIANDFFIMILQDVLMYNFSYKENKKILLSYKKYKNEILTKYDLLKDYPILPLWIKIINSFIDKNRITLISLFIRPIQIILSNKKIFKYLFVHLQKHEEYNGKL